MRHVKRANFGNRAAEILLQQTKKLAAERDIVDYEGTNVRLTLVLHKHEADIVDRSIAMAVLQNTDLSLVSLPTASWSRIAPDRRPCRDSMKPD